MPGPLSSSSPRLVAGTAAAAHEAGHAVAAVVLRLSLQYVTLRPRGGESGLAYTRKARNETRHYLEREAICALAGIAADQLINERVTTGSATDDIPHAKRIAERLGVDDVQTFLHAKLGAAERIISRIFEEELIPSWDKLGSSFHKVHSLIHWAARAANERPRHPTLFGKRATPPPPDTDFNRVMEEVRNEAAWAGIETPP